MKKLIFIILVVFSTYLYADSPLTSSEFYLSYSDFPQVMNAHDREDKTLTDNDIQFLTDKTVMLDAKLALINALGFKQAGKHNEAKYLNRINPNIKSYDEVSGILTSAEEAIIFAYLLAMDDYFNVARALDIAKNASNKAPQSLAIALILGLIQAQIELDNDWCQVYKVVNHVRELPNLEQDIKPDAVKQIFENYLDDYKQFCN
ncbi:hypothetical protein [uncultured Gilliamella sp.]|uniref:hypothetical protein n=1 Tax=uncultured Gilliamella sp. TaxID=1193505 RepID=UPI0025DA9529|nr:hypothetical protein [uncultured Gilliamella sp.]